MPLIAGGLASLYVSGSIAVCTGNAAEKGIAVRRESRARAGGHEGRGRTGGIGEQGREPKVALNLELRRVEKQIMFAGESSDVYRLPPRL